MYCCLIKHKMHNKRGIIKNEMFMNYQKAHLSLIHTVSQKVLQVSQIEITQEVFNRHKKQRCFQKAKTQTIVFNLKTNIVIRNTGTTKRSRIFDIFTRSF